MTSPADLASRAADLEAQRNPTTLNHAKALQLRLANLKATRKREQAAS